MSIITKCDHAGIPSPPLGFRHTVESSSPDDVVVSVEWDSPSNNGGADIDNYTVTISPEAQLSDTVVSTTTVTATVSYNVTYMVDVVATNCAGNSAHPTYSFNVCEYVYRSVFYYCSTYLGAHAPQGLQHSVCLSLTTIQGTRALIKYLNKAFKLLDS